MRLVHLDGADCPMLHSESVTADADAFANQREADASAVCVVCARLASATGWPMTPGAIDYRAQRALEYALDDADADGTAAAAGLHCYALVKAAAYQGLATALGAGITSGDALDAYARAAARRAWESWDEGAG